METRSAKKQRMPMKDSSHSMPNGQHSSQAVNGRAETEEMKQAAFVKGIQSTGALLLYLLSSSYIIILNKQLMVDDGFKFPLALTGLSQVAGALAGVLDTASPFCPMRALVSFLHPCSALGSADANPKSCSYCKSLVLSSSDASPDSCCLSFHPCCANATPFTALMTCDRPLRQD